jgi:hypothetical protein
MYKSKKHFDKPIVPRTVYIKGASHDYHALDTIKDFLQDSSRDFVIKGHVSGVRVVARDSDYGEITFATGSQFAIEQLMMKCVLQWNEVVKNKEKEKIESLARRKKQIQKELEEVSRELTAITLNKFENV